MDRSIAILGAGIVGVSCALELQRRGYDVTLFDRLAPGRETSYGNAGVMARSSLIPFNNPDLWRALPKLMKNGSASLRYDPLYVLKNLSWAMAFLAHARSGVFRETTAALDALIRLSGTEHARLLNEAAASDRLRDNGWLFLYRDEQSFQRSAMARSVYDQFKIATEVLNPRRLAELEPDLKPALFRRALWVKDSCSVDSPGRVVEAYAGLFVTRGGQLRQALIEDLKRTTTTSGWQLQAADGTVHRTQQVVLALGPWSKAFLKHTLGMHVPMAFERGYHQHYLAAGPATLNRPVYDTGGGYVLSPMEEGLRLTTGVQLTHQDAPKNLVQLAMAERAAREAFPIGASIDAQPWLGSRPTLPDSRPIIGECPRHAGVWLAFGHQHIGFSTGPGTASLLGAMMAGEACAIDPAPFRPTRFF